MPLRIWGLSHPDQMYPPLIAWNISRNEVIFDSKQGKVFKPEEITEKPSDISPSQNLVSTVLIPSSSSHFNP
jgi:hypothetical protein